MRCLDADKYYKAAIHDAYAQLNAKSRQGPVKLSAIWTRHKVSQTLGQVLQIRGFVQGKRGNWVWNPERDFPSDEVIEALRLDTKRVMDGEELPDTMLVLPLDYSAAQPHLHLESDPIPAVASQELVVLQSIDHKLERIIFLMERNL